ncbi:MAG: MFS transporter [Verrucomicrobia bacterium]|nr:MFS transporter [Verrucomicrobiota bacterium]MBV8486325.1 MFS transporter [Verrucomicrobiota bacterium]
MSSNLSVQRLQKAGRGFAGTLPRTRPVLDRGALPQNRSTGVSRWLALAVMLVGPLLGVIDFFIANIGINSIRTSLQAGFGEIELVVAGYGLTYAVCLITGGRLGDIYGRKKIFIVGLIGFTSTSALCGLAPNATLLVVWRLLQGCTAAIMFPQALSFIHVNFSGSAKRLAFSVYGAALGFGSILGQILGGFLIQANVLGLGWRPIFLINVPIGLATIAVAWLVLRESHSEKPTRLDPIGTVLLSFALFLFSLPFMEGRDAGWPAWAWIALAASVPLFALFLRWEKRLARRGVTPLVEPRLFQDRGFLVGIGITCIYFAGHSSMLLVLCLFLQLSLNLNPFQAGLSLAPFSFGFLLGSTFSGKLNGYLGRKSLHVGTAVLAVTLAALALEASSIHGQQTFLFVFSCFLYGIGRGLVTTPLFNTVLSGVPAQDAGAAAGIVSTAQQVANSVGIAVLGAVAFSVIPHHATAADYATGFVLSSVVNLFMVGAASILLFLIPKKRGLEAASEGGASLEAA